jgi:predicted DNA-binding transcriptional regulator YafY
MSDLRQLLYQHPRGVTVNEIAAHLRVTPRSARRYLRELKLDLEDLPDRHNGEKRWRIPPPDRPRHVALRRNQAYALLAARPLLRLLEGSALYEEIALANEMLVGVARRPGRGPNTCGDADDLERRFCYAAFAPEHSPVIAEHVDLLFHALAERHPVRCHLPSGPEELSAHTFEPYALLLYKDALHCIGKLDPDGAVRALPLSQLHGLRVLAKRRFELPDDFNIDDYHQGHFGLWQQDATRHHIVIDFEPNVSAMIRERRLHESQRVEARADGSVRLHLHLSSLEEVAMWVLGFGSGADVIGPAMLRERVAEELRKAAARYA